MLTFGLLQRLFVLYLPLISIVPHVKSHITLFDIKQGFRKPSSMGARLDSVIAPNLYYLLILMCIIL
jgi:hypothetical protein